MWSHKEINQVDCSANGEVTSVVYLKNYIFSGHSDGTLKVAACMLFQITVIYILKKTSLLAFSVSKSYICFKKVSESSVIRTMQCTQVWEGSENILRLVHEAQEHTKAITSLSVLHSEEKVFSGSLDRSIRVRT